DVIQGREDQDILIGGASGDWIDGDQADDLIFGDAVQMTRRPGVITNPRFQALTGNHIYSRTDLDGGVGEQTGQALVSGVARNYRNQDGSVPSWANWEVRNLYHSAAIEAGALPNSFGNDYIAGGPQNDVIFGQLGDDVIQGDGAIEGALAGSP